MIKIENVEVTGWEAAVRGMRNPMNSWDKGDSKQIGQILKSEEIAPGVERTYWEPCVPYTSIGPNDLDLMTRLRNAGADHRKFMRMITVYLDITAPLYWWKEFDTYKVGTVANSCSTMHKIADKEFTMEDFSHEHLNDDRSAEVSNLEWFEHLITHLNRDRRRFIETKDKQYWWQLIQLLPSSYNQRRTVMLNYEVLANIYKSRCNHKLDEWRELCNWIEGLPYSELITGSESETERIDHDSLCETETYKTVKKGE